MSADKYLEQAYEICKAQGIADCHCDTICHFMHENDYKFSRENSFGHIDLPRLEKGNVKVQLFAMCTETINGGGLKKTLQMIEKYHQNIDHCNDRIGHIKNFSDISILNGRGKIASILTIEGAGEALEGDLKFLYLFYRLGVRSLSLTWNYRNQLADGVYEEITGGGITRKGREVIKVMESLGMILDLAHLSSHGFYDAINIINKPPLVSHANARTLCENPRNLNDEQLKLLAEKNGVIGISFYPLFICENRKECNMERLLDHFVHIASEIGVQHLALGSDFDGIDMTLKELYDCTQYHRLIAGLLSRGFSASEIELIIKDNILRLLEKNLN